MTYLADTDLDLTLGPLRAAVCTYRIALGPRAGQKVLSLQTVPTAPPTPRLCANEQGFSLHAEVCCAAHQRKKLEHLCRYITVSGLLTPSCYSGDGGRSGWVLTWNGNSASICSRVWALGNSVKRWRR